MSNIATHGNTAFAVKAFSVTALLLVLSFGAYLLGTFNNELIPLGIVFGLFVGVFGTISIVNPSWFADDGYGQ